MVNSTFTKHSLNDLYWSWIYYTVYTDTEVLYSTMHLWVLFPDFADGLPVCWKSYIYCSVGCCSVIVHGVARFLYSKVAHCWRAWDSLDHSCWSWGVFQFFNSFTLFANFLHQVHLGIGIYGHLARISSFLLLFFLFVCLFLFSDKDVNSTLLVIFRSSLISFQV